MEDWLTYRLSDLLLFSPRTYYRLFELHNRALWPGHLAFLGAGISILVLARRSTPWSSTAIMVLLSACWLFVAWAFHLERYATINWAARYFAAAFLLQASLMLWHGLRRRRLLFAPPRNRVDRAAFGLVLFALFVEPLIGPLVGREWRQLEVFGATPDPTVIATLGILATASPRPPRRLLVIPALWCAISGATLWAMGSPDSLVVPIAGLIAVVVAALKRSLSSRASEASVGI
ncbi:MAG: DUF6064 family protein [Gemmatimonadota bacterium]|nr:DUF6064 family protein [Gemmatimonadota bacterium]